MDGTESGTISFFSTPLKWVFNVMLAIVMQSGEACDSQMDFHPCCFILSICCMDLYLHRVVRDQFNKNQYLRYLTLNISPFAIDNPPEEIEIPTYQQPIIFFF